MKCTPTACRRGRSKSLFQKNPNSSSRSKKNGVSSDSNSSLVQSVGLPLANEDVVREVELISTDHNFSCSQQSVTGGGVQRSTSVHSAQVTTERNSPTLLSASSLPTVTRVIPTRTSPGSSHGINSCGHPMEPVASPELLEECTQAVSEIHTDTSATSDLMTIEVETIVTPFKRSNRNKVTNSLKMMCRLLV